MARMFHARQRFLIGPLLGARLVLVLLHGVTQAILIQACKAALSIPGVHTRD